MLPCQATAKSLDWQTSKVIINYYIHRDNCKFIQSLKSIYTVVLIHKIYMHSIKANIPLQ